MNSVTIKTIHHRIAKLSFSHKLAFMYFVFNRLQPNYVAFYKQENWGNPEILQKAGVLLKNIILGNETVDKEIVEQLKSVTPDTDEFDTFLVSLALDACAALSEAFGFENDKNDKRIISVSTSAIDLTQMYIEFRDKTDFDDYAYNEPLMIEEINAQIQILDLLENKPQIDETFLNQDAIEKSKLGSLLTGIPMNELEITPKTILIKMPELQIENEIQDWLKGNNINITELIPELLRNFYRTVKTIQKNAAF